MRLVIKAKYTRRWKGKDGQWRYEYGAPKGRKMTKLPDGSGAFVATIGTKQPKKKTYTFDASKLGWKVKDGKNKGVEISNQHPGKYITMHAVFGEVTLTVHDSLPSSPYAPGDFRYGYAINGKWKDWSTARKVRYSSKMIEGPE